MMQLKLSTEKLQLLDAISNDLKIINGVKAIVIGGSHATGLADESSDLDIGIYYFERNPFDIEKIKKIAESYSNLEKPTITDFYEWGPWVNGGAWLKTNLGKVDFLYKNIDQIEKTINEANKGIWENSFEQQPPYGFSSIILLAETQICISLYDPEDIIKKLKKNVITYPVRLKESVIQKSLWSAEFTIWQAEKFASKSDLYNTIGCLTRAVNSIVSALFALNEIYPLGDKRAIRVLEKASEKPLNLSRKIDTILSCDKKSTEKNTFQLKELFQETVALAKELYKPYYKL
jgi:predicted nucleotidyltransferase